MTSLSGPLHEASFVIDEADRADVREWLDRLVERARGEDGICDVQTLAPIVSSDGRTAVTLQFRANDDAALDGLLDRFFADLDAAVAEQFGASVTVASRTYRQDEVLNTPAGGQVSCLNCGTRMRGQYCGSCGQRAHSRLISLWELTRDAFGDLLEIDSRLWRTLRSLMLKPGMLTKDYLQGRRARYMPPFRTYLVLSVVFFVVAFFNPRDDLSLLFEPEPAATAEEIAAAAEEKRLEEEERKADLAEAAEDLRKLEEAGDIPEGFAAQFEGKKFGVTMEGNDSDCDIDPDDLADLPQWLQKRITPERAQHICSRIGEDEGKSLARQMLDNIPVALIVLLPIMALVLKILYPLSKRYFVEHLLFFLHFHAFFFLILIAQILFARGMALLPIPEAIPILIIVASSFYVPTYLYIAMRRVYGQGHLVTTMKFLILSVAYLVGASMTLMGATLFALLSV